MKEFIGLGAKTWAYLMSDDSEKKKAQATKKCVIKRKLTFENFTNCSFNDSIILQLKQRFKSHHHNVYTEEINKIALSSNHDKRSQTFDKITAYPYEQMHSKYAKVRCYWWC